ncbi:hypothetical protein KIN34_00455 [Cellulomonas sp. DKR-3]|uniref:Big-1 domain-containing protein n=1 Tax=Cellulomonas fulva TaxID=2835530 RepID=A0ABS5TUE8_9CELL|nr:hypothetical protein [Cellulomonas fulva]MBT0992761.1 hypothetical protein [Cellulomonas fulva]
MRSRNLLRPSRSALRSRTVAALAASALVLGTGAAAATGGPPPATTPGPIPAASGWATITTSDVSSVAQPDLLRMSSAQGSRLLVGWTTSDAVRTRQLTTTGALSGPVRTVVSGWASLEQRVALVRSGAGYRAVLRGIRTTQPGERYAGAVTYGTSSDGAAWSLANGALSATQNGGYALDALDSGGTLVGAFSSVDDPSRLFFHVGAETTVPATTPDRRTSAPGGPAGYVYEGALARDARTGSVWAAWYVGSSDAAARGIWTQRILPTTSTPVRAPGSGTQVSVEQRVALVARSGGGLAVAYPVGYPFVTQVRLWRVGASTSSSSYVQVAARDARLVAASPGPSGRVWVAWATRYTGAAATVKAVRTSTTATRVGSVVRTRPLGAGTVWHIAAEGSRGPLDVVATSPVDDSSFVTGVFHTQVRAPLTVVRTPASVDRTTGGTVRVTVTDVGAPVAGATVRYAGRTWTTSASGVALVRVARGTPVGTKTVTVSRSGYLARSVTFAVRA